MNPTIRQAAKPAGEGRKRVLVHICCGPCSIYPLKLILGPLVEVWGFFHNPNIHPYGEFKRRLDAVKKLAVLMNLNVIYDETYRPTEFIKGLKAYGGGGKFPEEGKRCGFCYTTRLDAVARVATERGFDAFSSSLLYSRYQDHEGIKRFGSELARKYGVEFIYHDFREGWQEGIEQSKELGLYRQKYCGCIYSKIERYSKGKNKKKKDRLIESGS